MSEIRENILSTLAYFDLFNYPLTSGEICLFLKKRYIHQDYYHTLKCLVDDGSVYMFDKLYTLKNDRSLIARRYEGNKKAAELIKKAEKIGDLLIRFPYVRGIAISGSLSKNYADEKSDIDLFIITAKNRLWIARTIMHVFKKLTFLFNKQHYFCMNYYIDEEELEIVEKTYFTAMEIITLIPLQGDEIFEQFYTENSWTRLFFPNKTMRLSSAKHIKNRLLKSFIETVFMGNTGNKIDNALMKITEARWKKKTRQKKLNAKGNLVGMSVNKHFAKPDPRNFQDRLLKQYENKISGILLEDPTIFAR